MELREYGKLFLRRKWQVVFTVLFILFAASVYCVVTPELYKSSITILVIPQPVPAGLSYVPRSACRSNSSWTRSSSR